MTVRTRTYQAQLSNGNSTNIYGAGTGFVGRIDKLTLINTTSLDITGVKVYIGGTGTSLSADEVVTDLTLPAEDEVQVPVANHAIQAGDFLVVSAASGVNYYATITERTQRTP